jgi:hypothetical protein
LKDIHHGATKEVVEKWYTLQPVKDKDQKQKLARRIVRAKVKLAGLSDDGTPECPHCSSFRLYLCFVFILKFFVSWNLIGSLFR